MRETFDKALPRRYCPGGREHRDTEEVTMSFCTLVRCEKVGTVSPRSKPQVTSLLNGIHVGLDVTKRQRGSNAIDLGRQETLARCESLTNMTDVDQLQTPAHIQYPANAIEAPPTQPVTNTMDVNQLQTTAKSQSLEDE